MLSKERFEKLDKIGFVWKAVREERKAILEQKKTPVADDDYEEKAGLGLSTTALAESAEVNDEDEATKLEKERANAERKQNEEQERLAEEKRKEEEAKRVAAEEEAKRVAAEEEAKRVAA